MNAPAQPHFIVLEGLDGAGKSTLAQRLADQLGARLLTTPPAELRDVRPQVDDLYKGCNLASTLFYASAVAWASEAAKATLAAGQSVILDRYWLSTRVYGEVVRREPPPALDALLLPAHLTVFLDADEATREQRMTARRCLTPADADSLQRGPDLRSAYLALAQHPVAGRFLHIDTAQHDALACLDLITAELRP